MTSTRAPLRITVMASGRPIAFTTPAGARYFLKNVGTDDLLKLKRDRAVYIELLSRSGVRDEYRQEAVAALAKLEGKSQLRVLLVVCHARDNAFHERTREVNRIRA